MADEGEERWKSEEFSCPPGRISVDLVNESGPPGRGIHIYYFDPEVNPTDMPEHAMLPSRKQMEHVMIPLMRWLDENLC